MTDNKITDKSGDRDYHIQVPQIVMALCRTPYDFTLWSIVKMVAGEQGVCYVSTENLAELSMMSMAKVSDSREYLIAVGLLKGEVKKVANYPQPVWHLTVPDIWEENIIWRKSFDAIDDRVNLKKAQKSLLESTDNRRKFNQESYLTSDLQAFTIRSLHNTKPSQYEEGYVQNEEGYVQNETKKNQEEEPKKNHSLSATADTQTDLTANASSQQSPADNLSHEPDMDSPSTNPAEPTGPTFSANSQLPDIADFSLTEIQVWRLYMRQWQQYLRMEQAGRKRKNVIRYIRQKLNPKPQAVEIYREIACTYPEQGIWDMIASTVGDSEQNLILWRQVCQGYVACGWNKQNLANMLEFFKRREVPSAANYQNGHDKPLPPGVVARY